MIDLHCHILPGVDDGAATLSEALEMARFFVADGITHVTATPHCHRFTRLLRADVLPNVARFNEALARAGVPLVVLPGSEIQVVNTAEYRRELEAGLYCHLGDRGDYTLLELPWSETMCPPDVPDLVRWLRDRGMTPILAHPERHNYLRDDPAQVRALVDAGAWLQLTVDSLIGAHGPAAERAVAGLIRTYPDVVLATDAHNMKRCSGLAAGFRWVRKRLGEERERDIRERAARVLAALAG